MSRSRVRAFSLFVILAGLTVLSSLPGLFDQVRDVDVLLYASAAVRANAEGAPPYSVAWIEKGPVAVGLYQVLFAVFGPYHAGALAGAWIALATAGMGLAWALAREIGAGNYGPWAAAIYGGALLPLASSLNTEVPASVAVSAALWVWARSLRHTEDRSAWLAGAGALAAIGFLCRQNAGLLWPLLVVLELALAMRRRESIVRAVRAAAAVTAGFSAVACLPFLYYAWRGELATFWFCFYGYNADYYIAATKVDAERLLRIPIDAYRSFLRPVPVVSLLGSGGILLGATGLVARKRSDGGRPESIAAAGVALAAMGLTVSLFVGLRFFGHYFALPLPLWAALGGLAVARVFEAVRHRAPSPGARKTAVALIGLVLGAAIVRTSGLPLARESASRTVEWIRAGGLSDPGDPVLWPGRDRYAVRVGRWIRERTTSKDRIFVWGKRPHVYAYARRVPATRFVTCTFLTGLVPWERSGDEEDTTAWIVPGSWDLLLEDLAAEAPLYVVDASRDHMFAMGAYAPERFPRLDAFLRNGYERVHEVASGESKMVVWQRKSPSD
jgi:xanthosine utilization system XapX-like protein